MSNLKDNFSFFNFPNLPRVQIALGQGSLDLRLNLELAKEIIQKSRQELIQEFNLNSLYESVQIHTDQLIFTESTSFTSYPEADGLATNQAKAGLLIKTADCQAVFIAHKSQNYILALHAGWRGNKIAFIPKAIKEFCQHYQINATDLYALRSPSLGPEQAIFTDFANEWSSDFSKYYNSNKKTMDLWQITFDQLCSSGLAEENIYAINECTYSLKDKYHSFRRDKTLKRHGSLIWIN